MVKSEVEGVWVSDSLLGIAGQARLWTRLPVGKKPIPYVNTEVQG